MAAKQAGDSPVFTRATRDRAADVRAIAAACAADLRKRFGPGHWAGVTSLRTWKLRCDRDPVYLGGEVATFTLTNRKPMFVSKKLFAEPDAPFLWLSNLFVHPSAQRRGLGRACLAECRRLARAAGARWVRFDAYHAPAGASSFYLKCGCRLAGPARASGTALDVFELDAR